jgi:hypothetical protein
MDFLKDNQTRIQALGIQSNLFERKKDYKRLLGKTGIHLWNIFPEDKTSK